MTSFSALFCCCVTFGTSVPLRPDVWSFMAFGPLGSTAQRLLPLMEVFSPWFLLLVEVVLFQKFSTTSYTTTSSISRNSPTYSVGSRKLWIHLLLPLVTKPSWERLGFSGGFAPQVQFVPAKLRSTYNGAAAWHCELPPSAKKKGRNSQEGALFVFSVFILGW